MKLLSSLKNKDLSGKTCLLRVDFNIFGNTGSNLRLESVLPTIKFLIANGAKVVILSHRGRPKNFSKDYSLKFAADFLSKKLKKKINFIANFDFRNIKKEIDIASSGSIFLLENLRFLPSEEINDIHLAKQLASLGDFYVNDAFGVSHRKAASISAITKFLPSYAGLLLEKEIKNLSSVIKSARQKRGSPKAAKKPLSVILGGAKISDKIGLIKNFASKADYFLLGGGIAHNFLKAQGLPIGNSIFEESTIDFAKKMLKNKKVILPVDYAIANNKILDIGPNTINLYADIIKKSKTIVWNGPMGFIENKRFRKGSEEIFKAILKSRAFSAIGGGETATLLKAKSYKLKANIFISTGGGAMLKFLAKEKMPGIEALNDN